MSTMITPDQSKRILRAINDLKNTGFANRTCAVEKSPFDDDDEPPRIIEEENFNYLEVILRIFPRSVPFNEGGFRAKLLIPLDFPLSPPRITLITPIHHPNIGDEGLICLALLRANDGWTTTTTLTQVIDAVIKYIDEPELDQAESSDIATEYQQNREQFNAKARAKMRQNPVPRP